MNQMGWRKCSSYFIPRISWVQRCREEAIPEGTVLSTLPNPTQDLRSHTWNPSVARAICSQSEISWAWRLFLKHIPSTMKWKISFLCSEQKVLLRIFLLKKKSRPSCMENFNLNQIFNKKMIMFRVSYKFLAEDWLDVLKSCMTRISAVLKTQSLWTHTCNSQNVVWKELNCERIRNNWTCDHSGHQNLFLCGSSYIICPFWVLSPTLLYFLERRKSDTLIENGDYCML